MAHDLLWKTSGELQFIAHRGGAALGPTNTIDAVCAAADAGATAVEVDLHMTADGTFVIDHRTVVDHDDDRWISQMTIDEYRRNVAGRGDQLTLLDDLLEAVADLQLGLYLDVKQLLPGGERLLAAHIDRAGHRDRSVVASCVRSRWPSSPPPKVSRRSS